MNKCLDVIILIITFSLLFTPIKSLATITSLGNNEYRVVLSSDTSSGSKPSASEIWINEYQGSVEYYSYWDEEDQEIKYDYDDWSEVLVGRDDNFQPERLSEIFRGWLEYISNDFDVPPSATITSVCVSINVSFLADDHISLKIVSFPQGNELGPHMWYAQDIWDSVGNGNTYFDGDLNNEGTIEIELAGAENDLQSIIDDENQDWFAVGFKSNWEHHNGYMFEIISHSLVIYYTEAEDLILRGITVGIDETEEYKASNSITAAGEGSFFGILGNGLDGGKVTMEAGNFISLLPGFEAQEGCSLHSYIDLSFKTNSSKALTGSLPSDTTEKGTILTSAETEKKEIKEVIPKVFNCAQNYPNPFGGSTTIKYGLPEASKVNLEIYNLAGQKIRTLVSGQESAGFKRVSWDGKNSAGTQVPQGVYFYVFRAGDYTKHHKMILLK